MTGVLNLLALVAFAAALCWRIDQIRRHGGGLQALAMTMSVTTLTLAFVVSNASVTRMSDDLLFAGAARLVFYALLAVGVASLIIVFFFPGKGVTRERRAGFEAIPLVAALIGLQVSLAFVPSDMRTATLDQWSLKNWGFALFFLIASGYLAYGFGACVRSVRKFLELAEGILRKSLTLLMSGFGLLALGSIVQICYVFGVATGLLDLPWLAAASRVSTLVGLVGFLLGITFPMVHSAWQSALASRRRRRASVTLKPLWELVTDVVPEVVLPEGDRSSTAVLHRQVIEIRDALTQLSPLLPTDFDEATTSEQASALRAATAHYAQDGKPSGAVRGVLPEQGAGLEGDVAALLRVADALRHQAEPLPTSGGPAGG